MKRTRTGSRPRARTLIAAALSAVATLALVTSCASPGTYERARTGDADMADAEAHAFELLEPFIAARGVSGHEGPVREVVREQLRRINPDWSPVEDEEGNLILALGRGERTLLFIAHMDEVGLEVTEIREDGLLVGRKRGGYFDHLYQATAIELVTGGGVLPGVMLPPASLRPSQGPVEPEPVTSESAAALIDEAPFVIDIGATSAEQARSWGVQLGDAATVPKELVRLGRHRAAGRSNDDRVGCAALMLALEQLDVEALDRRVIFVWAVREEIGLEGADHVARTLRPVPETAFAVDTLVTSDSPRDDKRYAYAPLGAGPVLRALDNTSLTPRATLDRVRAIADRHALPLQTSTMGGGNDGSRFVYEGAIDCPLAWPQRNSHSRVETFDLRDMVHLGELVAAVAAEF
ncbi:MAG: M28 family peptidase [Planctomycetota bacterium]|jgi:putative aminopeptidase FrvX